MPEPPITAPCGRLTFLLVAHSSLFWQAGTVRIHSRFAYGDRGFSAVQPGSCVEYRLRVLSVHADRDESIAAIQARATQDAATRKGWGNVWFREGRWDRAARCYKAALAELQEMDTLTADITELTVALGNNLAKAEEKRGSIDQALEVVRATLKRAPADLKALCMACRLCVQKDDLEAVR